MLADRPCAAYENCHDDTSGGVCVGVEYCGLVSRGTVQWVSPLRPTVTWRYQGVWHVTHDPAGSATTDPDTWVSVDLGGCFDQEIEFGFGRNGCGFDVAVNGFIVLESLAP